MCSSRSPLDKYDLAVRGRGDESCDSLDAVNDRIEVLATDAEHVHGEGAGLDVHLANVFGLPQQVAPVLTLVPANDRGLRGGRLGRERVVRVDRADGDSV